MRTFYIAIAFFALLFTWLITKPIPKPAPVARAFTDAEIEYIERSFDYAMDSLKEGEHFDWSAAAVNARISAGAPYKSNLKADCRRYVEIARTYDGQRTESGLACKRAGREGWCRLNPKEPQSCALEKMESLYAKKMRYAIMQGSQVVDGLLGTDISVSTGGLAPPTPTIPSINPRLPDVSVETPEISRKNLLPMPWEPGNTKD